MGNYYGYEEPPGPPSGGVSPVIWALMGASVMMVIVAVLAFFFLPRRVAAPAAGTGAPSVATATAPPPSGTSDPTPLPTPGMGLPNVDTIRQPAYPSTALPSGPAAYPRGSSQSQSDYVPGAPDMSGSSGAEAPAVTEYRQPSVAALPQWAPPSGSMSFAPGRPSYRPGSPPASSGPSAQDVIARVKNSVVLLIVQDRRGNIFSGSGFPMGGNQVGTCAHVVADAARILIASPGGLRAAGQVLRADPDNDVAVVAASGRIPPPLALGSLNAIRDGDEIAATGYPDFFRFLDNGYVIIPSTTRGTVSAKRVRQVGPGVIIQELQMDATVNHGNSGGPVYSTRDGTVYGLAKSMVVGKPGMNFASSIDALRRLAGR